MRPQVELIRITHTRIFVPALLLSLACGNGGDLGPVTPGSVHVTTVTDGEMQDPNGYTLVVDGTAAGAVGPNADTTFSELPPGSHALALADVAGNCTVEAPDPRSVLIQSGGTTEVVFAVACTEPRPAAACVAPQVTNASQWAAAIAGNIGNSGDTIWVKGGSYAGESAVRATNRVIRACPGERVTLGNVVVFGSGITMWGFEVVAVGSGKLGISTFGVGSRLINNVVHDAGHSGIGLWWDTQGGEAYGNIVYNNGTTDNLDHGIYFNNRQGTMRLSDNVVFNNWAYGMHGFSSTPGELTGLVLDGNVTFGGHGIGAFKSSDVLIGGVSVPTLSVTNHRSYKPDGYTSVDLGYIGASAKNGSVMVSGTFVGSPGLQLNRWASINQDGATNISYAGRPTSGSQVYVRPNAYEPGRAHVVIYNWANASSVPVDLSTVLKTGQTYEVRSVCDLWGAPTAAGTYEGGSVEIPTASLPAPVPLGRSAKRPPPDCGGVFGVFLVLGK